MTTTGKEKPVNPLIEKDVRVRMRDGANLAADVYRPSGEARFPTLVMRLPYDKEAVEEVHMPYVDIFRAVRSGYAVVVQDTRGRFASEGDFVPMVREAEDGEDTIVWAAGQPWSDGNVGGIGFSYGGMAQLAAASRSPASLRAVSPVQALRAYDSAHRGGTFQLGAALIWSLYAALGEQ